MIIKTTPKFTYLDGLRGLSALFVAFYHAQLFTGRSGAYLESNLKPLNVFLSYGHFSVAIFIVLSGFCLTIPVALSEDKFLKGGFKRYIKRRFTRIIPPYYVALVLFIILIFSIPMLQTSQNTVWDSKIPVTFDAVVAHILLIHNFSESWIFKIDGPMWSVATEWQIYFIFPILLYLWRRYGIVVSIVFANILGVIVALRFSLLHPWYLGLFSTGMVGSIICFSKDEMFHNLRSKINWPIISKLASAGLLILAILIRFIKVNILISETFVGLCICIILINFTLIETKNEAGSRPFMLSIFNTRFAVFLGSFSYSIYLIHSPILGYLNLLTINFPIGIDLRLILMLGVAVPISVLISYVFYLLVERKFIPGKTKAS